MNLFEDLNDSQKQAVSHIDGAMLILAGAGSGKNQKLSPLVLLILSVK